MTSRHVVKRAAEGRSEPGAGAGSSRWAMLDESTPAVHTGFGVCTLEPGGSVPPHVHSYEESFYVLDGPVVLRTTEGSRVLRAGDYGVLPVGLPHAWRPAGDGTARWVDMLSPQPPARNAFDTYPVALEPDDWAPIPVDVRDPRNRLFGHVDPSNMDADKQTC
jgi:quercetin dioxygenase-like cupin family protein